MKKANTQLGANGKDEVSSSTGHVQPASLPEIYKHLNFKVPPEFHREFKTFAASHDISMTTLLIESFQTLQESQR